MTKISAYNWVNSQVKSEDLYENSRNLDAFLIPNRIFEDDNPLFEKMDFKEDVLNSRTKDSIIFENLIALNETKHVLLRIEDLCNDLVREFYNYDLTNLNKTIKLDSDNVDKVEKEFNIKFDLYISVRTDQRDIAKIYELGDNKYLIAVPYKVNRQKQEIREAISHELVHLVEKSITGIRPSYLDVDVSSSNFEFFVDNFLYIYSKQEINARLTELYFALQNASSEEIESVSQELEKKSEDFKLRSEQCFDYVNQEDLSNTEAKLTKNYWKLITLYDKMISYFYVLEKTTGKEKEEIVKIFRDRTLKTRRNPFKISSEGDTLKDFEKIKRISERIIKAYTRKIRGVFKFLIDEN